MVKHAGCIALTLLTAVGLMVPLLVTANGDVPLEALLTPADQAVLNTAGMSAQQRAVLRAALIAAFAAGVQQGRADGLKSASAPRYTSPSIAGPQGGVIETRIDGDFEGWEGETIVRLENGEIWQQTEYHYEYHYAYMPKVLIYESAGGWKMKVDGTGQAVGVSRLR